MTSYIETLEKIVVRMSKELEQEKTLIAELGRDKETLTQHHDMWKCQWHELHSSLPIRDLEQQAKGVRDFFTNHRPRISMGKSAIWEVDDVLVDECIERLTTKSEALKEQVK